MLVVAFALTGCAGLSFGRRSQPEWVVASATAPYRAVDVPGRQRREAQNDAETLARRQLLNEIGRMRVTGKSTLNDLIARDPRLRAAVLDLVRTAEVYDWRVDETRGEVSVSIRLDRNRICELLAPNNETRK
ncbi:MAG: hypothetical protein ACPL7D_02645 [Candidatus Sumerlaeaceae bacterium]